MPVIAISRGTFSGGRRLAELLAEKLGCICLSREDFAEEASRLGIPVGKLQTVVMKPPSARQHLARQREQYLAFTTARLTEFAQQGNLVYHGHAAHLLLAGVAHVLRVRIVADPEQRLELATARMHVSREQAKRYIADVDEDRRRWVRFLYDADWADPYLYDIVINLEHLSIENAASAICSFAGLPDHQQTPASKKAVEDLNLASRARLALSLDARTAGTGVCVRADTGKVMVTYPPLQAGVLDEIPRVLEGVAGIQELNVNLATSCILWIQEEFDPASENFAEVLSLAKRWDAAVDLLRFVATDEEEAEVEEVVGRPGAAIAAVGPTMQDGGIEDDTAEAAPAPDGGLRAALAELGRWGRSAGGRTVRGKREAILATLARCPKYSLVVVGEIYREKPAAARVRLATELRGLLADRTGSPVVNPEEIRRRNRFGAREAIGLAGLLAVVAVLYLAVFANQGAVVRFLSGDEYKAWRPVAVIGVLITVPLVAFLYSSAMRRVLRVVGLE